MSDESMDFFHYLKCEIFGIRENSTPVEKEKIITDVNNLFRIPFELEKSQVIGVFICFDTFLYFFTYFPLRLVLSIITLCFNLPLQLFRQLGFLPYLKSPPLTITHYLEGANDTHHNNSNHNHHPHGTNGSSPSFLWNILTVVQLYDLFRLSLLGSSFYLLYLINLSNVYHLIRSQNTIKLYVLSSMIEVIDKLFASFGFDLFDSIQYRLYYHHTFPIRQTLFAYFYVALHSLLYLSQVATLTVVINSTDDALLTILILNNFSELRSFVFKKYDQNNFFQLTCSDIMERFQLIVFVSLVFIVTMIQGGLTWVDSMNGFFWIILIILAAEGVADCFKHCFICKFNFIPSSVYHSYRYVLIQDILTCGKEGVIVDHTYSVSKRIGLCQIPLVAVYLRYVYVAITSPMIQSYFAAHSSRGLVGLMIGGYIGLFCIKIFFARFLYLVAKKSGDLNWYFGGEKNVTEDVQNKLKQLHVIQRYTVYNGRIL